jgi:hypothetical protein
MASGRGDGRSDHLQGTRATPELLGGLCGFLRHAGLEIRGISRTWHPRLLASKTQWLPFIALDVPRLTGDATRSDFWRADPSLVGPRRGALAIIAAAAG